MVDSGQFESALKPLEEGLARFPDNAWLLTRKAIIEVNLKRPDAAKATLQGLLGKNPGHVGATILLTRLLLDTEGPGPAIAQFQQGLSAMAEDHRRELAPMAQYLGVSLSQAGLPIAAMKHLELAARWAGDQDKDQSIARSIRQLRGNPRLSAWEQESVSAPAGAGGGDRRLPGVVRAGDGLGRGGPLGLGRLGVRAALGRLVGRRRRRPQPRPVLPLDRRQRSRRRGPSPIHRAHRADGRRGRPRGPLPGPRGRPGRGDRRVRPPDLADPRPRGAAAGLEASPYFVAGPPRPIHQDDPDSSPTERFFLLDRPRITARPGLTPRDIPTTEAEVIVGEDTVVLETYDDNRLNRLIDRFTAAARATIPPAHPRTKVIEKVPRYVLALSWQWSLPEGLSDEDEERLNREQRAHILGEVWPETPNPALRRRTPIQAARAGDAETALRAAIRLLESTEEDTGGLLDWDQVRGRLGLKPEPAVDPKDLDLDRLHLSRWPMIPAAELDDDRLVDLYHRAREWGMPAVANAAGRVIAERPSLLSRYRIDPLGLFGSLAIAAARKDDRAAAQEWVRRGRQAESLKPAPRTLEWELTELQVAAILDRPEVWVPTIVVLLERYRGNQDATSAVLYRLVQMGLVQPVVDPNHPGQVLLDTGILDRLVAAFGPRVTTAAGEIGVAAGRGEIWTPDAARGGAAIWTPGSDAAAAPASGQERSRLILPGQ